MIKGRLKIILIVIGILIPATIIYAQTNRFNRIWTPMEQPYGKNQIELGWFHAFHLDGVPSYPFSQYGIGEKHSILGLSISYSRSMHQGRLLLDVSMKLWNEDNFFPREFFDWRTSPYIPDGALFGRTYYLWTIGLATPILIKQNWPFYVRFGICYRYGGDEVYNTGAAGTDLIYEYYSMNDFGLSLGFKIPIFQYKRLYFNFEAHYTRFVYLQTPKPYWPYPTTMGLPKKGTLMAVSPNLINLGLNVGLKFIGKRKK